LLDLVEDLARRLRALGVRGRTLELKVRTAGFQTHSRSATLATPTDVTAALWQAAADLFDGKVSDDWLPVRLLGVGVTGLVREGEGQGELFDAEWQAKQRALDRVQDAIRQRFGTDALRRAGGHRRTGTDD
jgi:DNA polymerase-4